MMLKFITGYSLFKTIYCVLGLYKKFALKVYLLLIDINHNSVQI